MQNEPFNQAIFLENVLEFLQKNEPKLEKPIVIAAMQDMGNVGSIVVDFINKKLRTELFRVAKSSHPTYVLDLGGHIELPTDTWEYRNSEKIIIFGGGIGQPQSDEELHVLCQDVIDISKKFSAKFIYTLGGYHTDRVLGKEPKTFVTATSEKITKQVIDLGINTTPQKSIITGFNGLILGYAKINGLQGLGLYGELNEPSIPQYRAAKSILKTLEKLTYQNFGDFSELEILAEKIESSKQKESSSNFEV